MTRLPKGQVLIGIIISLAIFLILSQAVITLVFSAYDLVLYTRARTIAKHLATERIEEVRNLAYENVGTIGGIPPGALSQQENIIRNGLSYIVRTRVNYIDDPFDGLAPNDLMPTDYKRVRTDVSWGGVAPSRGNTITLLTDVTPRGTEVASGTGTLSILVFNSQGQPVSQATAHILATSLTPQINLSLETNDNGRIILPGTPNCDSCYQITVSKEGYSSERTYTSSEVANPAKPQLTIIEGQVSEVSFAIDLTSTLSITSLGNKEAGFPPLPGQALHIRGTKIIGTDGYDSPVYKLDQDFATDSNANYSFEDMEWDNYEISLPSGSTFNTATTNPLQPIIILPAQTTNFSLALTPKTANSLLTIFKNSSQELVASVSAKLREGTFEASESSGLSEDPDFGQIFWSNLDLKTYLLEATVSGYATYSANVAVSGYTTQTIILNTQ